MSCFPCFQSQKSKKLSESKKLPPTAEVNVPGGGGNGQPTPQTETGTINAKTFTFRELASATKNFRQECLLGEGGFGRVYRGMLHPSGQVVAVKQLDRNGLRESKELMSEISTISHLNHENLVNLVGYCTDGDQRLLVYEYMPGGSLQDHLLDLKDNKALDWKTRMKIGHGAAQAVDTTRPTDEQNLVAWAQPILRDPKRFPDMADPNLNRQFPEKSLNQAVAIAAMCVQEEPAARPLMSDVMTALSFLTAVEDAPAPITPPVMSEELNKGKDTDSDSSDGDNDYEDGDSEEEEDENGKSKRRGSKKNRSSKRRDDGSESSSSDGRESCASDSLKKKSKNYFSIGRKSSKNGSDSFNHQVSSVFSLSKKSRGGDEDDEEKEACLSRNSSRSSHSNLSRNSSRAQSRKS
ncbi:hypothetical protein ACFE04_028504 [Oxalis oulophora]